MTTDINDYVKFLVEKGNYTNENAISIINKLKAKIAELMPNDSDEAREQILNLKIRDLVMASSAEKYDAIIVAMDAVKDGNGYNRYLAVQAFKADPARAIGRCICLSRRMTTSRQLISAGKKPQSMLRKSLTNSHLKDGIIALDTKPFLRPGADQEETTTSGSLFPLRMQARHTRSSTTTLFACSPHADAAPQVRLCVHSLRQHE